jgi:hypothetical protein
MMIFAIKKLKIYIKLRNRNIISSIKATANSIQ